MNAGTLDSTTTLADLVTAHPELARELERRGLDYCCGGASTLADACARAGLDTPTVAAELAGAATEPSTPAWSTMDAVELVDHLVETHHRYLWDALPRLTSLADKIVSVHGARHPELVEMAATVHELRDDLEPHLRREEAVLFPMVRELAVGRTTHTVHRHTLADPISVMLREHDSVGDLLARLRTLTDGYRPPADACASYTACFAGLAELEADTHQHVHKENNRLFPMVLVLDDHPAVGS